MSNRKLGVESNHSRVIALDLGAPSDGPRLAEVWRPMLDVDEECVLGEQAGELARLPVDQ